MWNTITFYDNNNDVKFNSEKVEYGEDFLNFIGNIISYNEIRAGRIYCGTIPDMERPKDLLDFLGFLALVKYLARFIPNLLKITAELRNLAKLGVKFE